MSRPRVVTAVTAVVLLVLAVAAFDGALTRERAPVASTGAPPPLAAPTPIEVPAGDELCAENVLLSPRTEVAQLLLAEQPGPQLTLVASGDGYRSPPSTADPADADGPVVTFRLEPPDREILGRVCVRSARGDAAFVGTEEGRTISRLQTTVGGEPVPPDVALTLFEDRSVSVLSYLPDAVDRMTAFRGFLGHAWLVWALLGLVVAGVPLAVLFVLLRGLTAAGQDRPASARPGPSPH